MARSVRPVAWPTPKALADVLRSSGAHVPNERTIRRHLAELRAAIEQAGDQDVVPLFARRSDQAIHQQAVVEAVARCMCDQIAAAGVPPQGLDTPIIVRVPTTAAGGDVSYVLPPVEALDSAAPAGLTDADHLADRRVG